eukprot:10481879-Ditylum_brightwellii.AAC.1
MDQAVQKLHARFRQQQAQQRRHHMKRHEERMRKRRREVMAMFLVKPAPSLKTDENKETSSIDFLEFGAEPTPQKGTREREDGDTDITNGNVHGAEHDDVALPMKSKNGSAGINDALS